MKEIKDHYFFMAKKEGYPARSVYKLIEAQNRFKFLKKGQRILDLGAAPGSWTKYVAKLVGRRGLIVAVDLHRLKFHQDNVVFLKEDIYQLVSSNILKEYAPFDVVLSDMAPKTTGRKDRDHYLSIDLARTALQLASHFLVKKGCLYCKAFDGEDFPALRMEAQQIFKAVKIFKPKSSRRESVEKFLFCKTKR